MKAIMILITLLAGGVLFYFFSRMPSARDRTSAPPPPDENAIPLAKAASPKKSKSAQSNKKKLDKARQSKEESQLASVMLHQIGTPSEGFQGRRAIILELAGKNRDGTSLIGIHGGRGMGKTATMNKVLDHLIPHYRDAQIYFDLSLYNDPVQAVTQAMAHVVHSFHRKMKTPSSLPELKLAYQAELKNKNAILFFDNVSNASQVQSLTPSKSCLMAITSEEPLKVSGLFQSELPEMSSEEMQDLMNNLCPRIGFWTAEISKNCGFNPLAGSLCANFLTEFQQVDPAGFSTGLRDFHKTLSQTEQDKKMIGLEAVLTMVYSMIPDPLAQTLARLALFPEHFSSEAEHFVCEDNEGIKLETLARLGWVEWDDHTGRYFIPRMVREWLLKKGKSNGRAQGEERFSTYFMTQFSRIHELIQGGQDQDIQQGLARFDLERKNLSIGQEWAARHCVRDKATSGVCNGYGEGALDVLHWRIPPKDRLDWLEPALKAAQNLQDTDMEQRYLLGLGKTCRTLKKRDEAIEHLNKCLPLFEKSGSINELLEGLNILGSCYKDQRQFDKALQCFEKRKSLSREHKIPETLVETLEAIGRLHLDNNDHDKAILIFKEAQKMAQKENLPVAEIRLLTALGETSLKLGKPTGAQSYFQQALDANKGIGDDAQTANLNACLGETYFLTNEPAKATPFLETAAQLFKKCRNLGGQARAMGQGGLCKIQAGDTPGGMALVDKSKKLFKQAKDLKGEAQLLARLGHIQLDKNMKPEADTTLTSLLNLAQKTKLRAEEASAHEGLGRLNEIKGNPSEAEKHYQSAHKLFQAVNPLEAPRVLKRLDSLSKSARAT